MKKKKNYSYKSTLFFIFKLFLIGILVYSISLNTSSYSNSIPLLAVSETKEGEVTGGSVVDLSLTTTKGSGQIYVNLKTIKEIDTQASLINSHKAACKLFSLDCENHDFYYEFSGSSVVLKGPSASAAIAILASKTLNDIQVDQDIAITGALSSGGIIGNVGGVEEKIKVAQSKGFKKVLIPTYSNYNLSNETTIEVIPVIDVIEAHNQFSGQTYSIQTSQPNKESYLKHMKTLAEKLCLRNDQIQQKINFSDIKTNTSYETFKNQAETNINSSNIAKESNNYYSQGSFCFSANNNHRFLSEIQKNQTKDKIKENIDNLENQIRERKEYFSSKDYLTEIQTINDYYVFLLLNDRIEEAKDFIDQTKENTNPILEIIENTTLTQNITKKEKSKDELLRAYSFALERFETVKLWEDFILHEGKSIVLSEENIKHACSQLNRELLVKHEVLKKQGADLFEELIQDQRELEITNKHLCLYKGLELNARMSMLLSSIGVDTNNHQKLAANVFTIAENRISINSNGDFPLIPFIYYEYASDLLHQNDSVTSLLYSNYALSYTDLNLLVEEEKQIPYLKLAFTELSNNIWFYIGMLFLLGFLN